MIQHVTYRAGAIVAAIVELPMSPTPDVRLTSDLIGRCDGIVYLHRCVGMEESLSIRVNDCGFSRHMLVGPTRWTTRGRRAGALGQKCANKCQEKKTYRHIQSLIHLN